MTLYYGMGRCAGVHTKEWNFILKQRVNPLLITSRHFADAITKSYKALSV